MNLETIVQPVLHLVRITIEAASPLSLASGDDELFTRRTKDREGGEDREGSKEARAGALARDANGLPTIPGSSLQGVLRHLYGSGADELFGRSTKEGERSGRLLVGFGSIHGSDDRAVVGLLDEKGFSDKFLSAFRARLPAERRYNVCGEAGVEMRAAPALANAILMRDHVRLNERHVVTGRKKFERLAIPVGTRFSFELAMWGAADKSTIEADKRELERIVGLLGHPAFRLGGAGRRGYGKVAVMRASYARPNLHNIERLCKLRADPPSTSLANGNAENWSSKAASGSGFDALRITLRLKPENPWRVGGSSPTMTEATLGLRLRDGSAPTPPGIRGNAGPDARGKGEDGTLKPRDSADVLTMAREPRIVWRAGQASIEEPVPTGPFAFSVPGSALKGPIVHRAIYHWNRTGGGARTIDADRWLAEGEKNSLSARVALLAACPAELERLFGSTKERDAGEKDPSGRAARILFDDAAIKDVVAVQAVDHISIDRFTGGVRKGALFVEEVMVGGTVEAVVTVLPPLPDEKAPDETWPEAVMSAFCQALRDLTEGRLAIGAKSLGYMSGDVEFDGAGSEAWRRAWREARGATQAGAP